MADELTVYQYKTHPLVQITDGHAPHTLPEYSEGWQLREKITRDAIGAVSARSPTTVLEQIEGQGYVSLDNFEINEDWRKKWVKE